VTLQKLRSKWPALRTVPLEHGPGWIDIIDRIMAAIYIAGFDEQRDEIRQIKEKFGTLRVYFACDVRSLSVSDCEQFQGGDRFERILKAIRANDSSGRTCEECGQPGRLLVSAGWWATRCHEHRAPDALPPAEYYAQRNLKR